ncbi:MAG: kinase [Alphaproteobacteria bacterium]|nr:kinase [Alphaproteobacteria bacterium]MDD9919865.1 kinase [Alphaproteobacteria bacterium]
MIITQTPYRISFFGGGTDLPAWFNEHGGAVLSCTINHYSWLTCRYLPPFFDHKHRVAWSKLERPNHIEEIEHPAVRGALEWLNIGKDKGIDISVLSDLPARAGLGSSSTFGVGLLNALYTLQGKAVDKKKLAQDAIYLERTLLAEAGGIQDQIAAAFGGLNHVTIQQDGDFTVSPLILPVERRKELQDHMMLFFSGTSRSAATMEVEKEKNLKSSGKENKTKTNLHEMAKLVDVAKDILTYGKDITEFGELLHETWQLKRGLAAGVSPTYIDDMYETARKAGAIGGKLLGAGGGGFFLVFAKPEQQAQIREALSDLIYVPIELEYQGTRIVMHDHKDYDAKVYADRDIIHQKKAS